MELIKCNKCGDDYNIKGYYKSKHKSHPKGYITPCKVCIKKQTNNNYNGEYHKNRLKNLSPEKKLQRTKQLTKRARERRKNPIVRLKESIRTRIYNGLKSNKDRNTEQYLGCNISEYKLYLESKFTPEMNWENYGTEWEIDHIKPICSFDLMDEQQMFECFHFKNTQPLNKVENREKSGTF
jgi:hypothetical protein